MISLMSHYNLQQQQEEEESIVLSPHFAFLLPRSLNQLIYAVLAPADF